MKIRIMKKFLPPTSIVGFLWELLYSLALFIDGLTSTIMLGLWGTDLCGTVYVLRSDYENKQNMVDWEDELEIIHDPPDPES